jgi:hypothetical protein
MANFVTLPRVRIVEDGFPPREYDAQSVLVGRSETADFQVRNSSVSAKHLEVAVSGGSLWIKDLGSRFGTFIDGEKLPAQKFVRCRNLVVVRVGTATIRVGLYVEGTTAKSTTATKIENSPVVVIGESEGEGDTEIVGHHVNKVVRKPPGEINPQPPLFNALVESSDTPKTPVVPESIALVVKESQQADEGELSILADTERNLRDSIASLTEKLAEMTARKENAEVELAKFKSELSEMETRHLAVNEKLENLHEAVSSDDRKYQWWKQEKKIEIQKIELAIKSRKLQIENEKTTLELELQKLLSEKITIERERKGLENNLNQNQIDLDYLRKRADQIAVGNERAEEKRNNLQHEYDTLSVSFKQSAEKYESLLRLVESTESQLKKLTKEQGEVQAHVDKARSELDSLVASLATEKERSLATTRAEIQKEADSIRSSSLEDGKRTIESLKAQMIAELEAERTRERESLEAERQELLGNIVRQQAEVTARLKAESDAVELRLKQQTEAVENQLREETESVQMRLRQETEAVESRLREQTETVESRLREQTETAEAKLREDTEAVENHLKNRADDLAREIANKRRAVDQELGQRMATELKEFEIKVEEQDKEWKQERSSRVHEIVSSIERNLAPKLETVFKDRGKRDQFIVLMDSVRPIVERAFRSAEGRGEELTSDHIKIDPKRIKTIKRFWGRLAVGVTAAVLIIGLVLVFQEPLKKFGRSFVPKTAADDQFVQETKDLAEKSRFNPPTDTEFKRTFTDNVLYTTNYLNIKMDEKIHGTWVVELNHFFLNDLQLDEKTVVKYVSTETVLIDRMSEVRKFITSAYEKQGIDRLRAAEADSVSELLKIVKGQSNFDKVHAFESKFYRRMLKERSLASDHH